MELEQNIKLSEPSYYQRMEFQQFYSVPWASPLKAYTEDMPVISGYHWSNR